jgi:hypothetical protein
MPDPTWVIGQMLNTLQKTSVRYVGLYCFVLPYSAPGVASTDPGFVDYGWAEYINGVFTLKYAFNLLIAQVQAFKAATDLSTSAPDVAPIAINTTDWLAFATDTTAATLKVWYSAMTSAAWAVVGNGGADTPPVVVGAPAATATQDKTRVFVAVRSVDRSVSVDTALISTCPNSSEPASTAKACAWSGWTNLGGTLVSNLALVPTGGGNVMLLGRGSDQQLWLDAFVNNQWNGWQRVAGNGFDGAPAAVFAGGKVIAGIHNAAGIYFTWLSPDGATLIPWTQGNNVPVFSDLAMATFGTTQNNVAVFYVGTDHQVYGGAFVDGVGLGWSQFSGSGAAGGLGAVSADGQSVTVFARALNNPGVWINGFDASQLGSSQTGVGPGRGWSQVGGGDVYSDVAAISVQGKPMAFTRYQGQIVENPWLTEPLTSGWITLAW